MKLVFTQEEVAEALQKTVEEFTRLRPGLEVLGFPKPVRGLDDRWAIMDVITWVNGSNEAQVQPGLAELGSPPVRFS